MNVVIVGRGRVFRAWIPSPLLAALLAVLIVTVALQAWVWTDYLSLKRRAREIETARAELEVLRREDERVQHSQAAEIDSLRQRDEHAQQRDDQLRRRDDQLRRRIKQAWAELATWSTATASIERAIANRGGIGGPATPLRAEASADAPVPAQLDELISAVREQGQKLRALQPLVVRVARIFAALPSLWPLRGPVNSEFGRRVSPWSASTERHEGIDIGAATGTAVHAPAPGTVVFAGHESGYGNAVLLDHGEGVQSRYGHLHLIRVKVGQRVARGDVIADSGNTGRSTGPHLHYEVIVKGQHVDPRRFFPE